MDLRFGVFRVQGLGGLRGLGFKGLSFNTFLRLLHAVQVPNMYIGGASARCIAAREGPLIYPEVEPMRGHEFAWQS